MFITREVPILRPQLVRYLFRLMDDLSLMSSSDLHFLEHIIIEILKRVEFVESRRLELVAVAF